MVRGEMAPRKELQENKHVLHVSRVRTADLRVSVPKYLVLLLW